MPFYLRFLSFATIMVCFFLSPLAIPDAMAANIGDQCTSAGDCPGMSTCTDGDGNSPDNPNFNDDNATCTESVGSGLQPLQQVLCDIISWLMYGNLGKGLAVLAVGMVGVGALLGKTSWGMAITVGVGIAIMFNAPDVVTAMGISTVACPSSSSSSTTCDGSNPGASCTVGGQSGSCTDYGACVPN